MHLKLVCTEDAQPESLPIRVSIEDGAAAVLGMLTYCFSITQALSDAQIENYVGKVERARQKRIQRYTSLSVSCK